MVLSILVIAALRDLGTLARLRAGCGGDFRFTQTSSLDTALVAMRRQAFDALLLDVDPDGLAARLRRLSEEAEGIPVIVLTDADDHEIGARVVAAGAQDYLVKSRINGDILRRVIRYSRERLRTQREVASLSRQRGLILETIAEGVLGTDDRGRIIYANTRGQTLLGRRLEDLVGRTPRETLGCPPDAARCEDCFAGREDGRVTFVTEGDSPLEFQCTAVQGGTSGVVIVFRDLSERIRHERELERLVDERTRALTQEIADRRKIEAALLVSQDRIRAITESLFEGVLVLEPDGRIVFSNQAAQTLLGEGRSLADCHLDQVLFLLEDGGAPMPFDGSPLRGVAQTGETLRDDDAAFLSGGRRLQVAYAASPLIDGGRRSGIIISFRDIGALKRAQHEALQASKLASVGQLAAGIAHEINTPIQYIGDNLRFIGDSLASLSGLIACSLQDAASEKIRHMAREADLDFVLGEVPVAVRQSLEGVDHISRIVLAMRAFSHPSDSERKVIDLNEAIATVLTVSRNEWKHVARLQLALDPDLPHFVGAPGEINQVLLNLIVNAAQAIEATPQGSGVISIATRVQGNWIEVAVGDDGIGMGEDVKQRIFDPFFTTKEVGKGTGQGLAICHDIVVNKHHGRIAVDSVEGGGSTFLVAFPAGGVAA